MTKSIGGVMKRRHAILAVGAAAAVPLTAYAQASRPMKRIGFLGLSPAPVDAGFLAAFRSGMVEQGLAEGRDYTIDVRSADGNIQAAPALAADMVATRPDVLLTMGDPPTKMLMEATRTIPIVFGVGMDPLGSGVVASLRQPGGNATGFTTMTIELWPKRLQIFKEAFPRVVHIGVLFGANLPASAAQVKEMESAAPRLGLRVSPIEIRQAADIEPAFKRGTALGVQAWAVPFDSPTFSQRRAIADHLIRLKLPSMFAATPYAEDGGLTSYATMFTDNFRRAAAYVDKILKGAKPGDLPVEQATRFELVVNTKTAKAIGVTVRESVMVAVDRVIG